MLISKFDTDGIKQKVTEFEKKHAITLPEQYRRFLLRYNGGRTPDTTFRMRRDSLVIRAFYGLGDVAYSLTNMGDPDELDDWLKISLLPIACDVFGNRILIRVGEDNNGAIYFGDHENGKTKLLAADLKEFVGQCKSKKCGPIKTIEERERDLIAMGRGHIIDDELKKCWQDEIDIYGNIHQERAIID